MLGAGYLAGAILWGGYPLVRSVPLAIGVSALDGTVFTLSSTLFDTLIQEQSPTHAVGRIYAVIRAMGQFCSIAGMLLGGAVATFWGIRAGFLVSIVVSVGLLLAVFVWRKRTLPAAVSPP